MKDTIISELKKEISGIKSGPEVAHIGTVLKIGDDVVEISGLSDIRSAELLEIEVGENETVICMALNLEEYSVKAIILGESARVREGNRVRATGTILSLPVSDALLGRVIGPLGDTKDDGAPLPTGDMERRPLEHAAPGVIERKSVSVPLHTGIKAIDALIPIGRGQRELIIGDRQTGKTSLAVDTIVHQGKDSEGGERKRPVCIYVAVGQKESKIAQIVEEFRQTGALEYTIVVSASASEPVALQYLAPYAGAAIGEYFMERGDDALVVYDDLSKQATAYRQLSLLLRRPPGREAYPGDIFYLHSRLLERAGRLSDEKGGGSLTALPIIETQLGDISAFVPTNVISITDGQIYLEPELFYKGIRPAVNVGLSVSRVGSSAQTKAMKKVAGTLKLDLAQFRELAAFAQLGQDLEPETQEKLERGKRLTEVLKQPRLQTLPFEEQVVIVFAATNGFLDGVAEEHVEAFETDIIAFMHKRHTDILEAIRTNGVLEDDILQKLKKAVKDFTENFFNADEK